MTYITADDVSRHADAMEAIRDSLAPFPPEEQLVIVAGAMGNVLCKVGKKPNRNSAILLAGTAMEMVFDMIARTYPLPDDQGGQSR